MILKALTRNDIITINYYQNGSLQTCKGLVYNLNLHQQTLSLKDEQQKVFSIHLSSIKTIH